MQSLTLHTRVGKDGILKLEAPIGIVNADLEVILVVQPLGEPATGAPAPGWTPDFFKDIVGGWQGEPLVREPQGTYEVRNVLQ
jgi:hypothetical protein